tara:strand:- start:909 stop:1106 length:198 start_codon:yes stop_codon:yes gene_type:complete
MSEINTKACIENWIKEKNVVDIRFYPRNASTSSVEDLLSSAHLAIKARSLGETMPYVDHTEESFL